MKKYAIITSLLTIVAVPAYAAIDCATPPTCESLGYTDTKSSCKGKFLPCPLDDTQNTGICVPSYSCTDLGYKYNSNYCSSNYIACPFDTQYRVCIETNKSGCDLAVNRYYEYNDSTSSGTCTDKFNGGVSDGIYIGNGYVLRFSRVYAGGSLNTTTLSQNCASAFSGTSASLALSSDLSKANGYTGFESANYGTLDGVCRKWTGSAFGTINCSEGYLYGLCKHKIN